MEPVKKVAVSFVYFREMPDALESTLKSLKMTFAKDGVSSGMGHQCPRITVYMELTNAHEDEKRVDRLERILTGLDHNNQIAGYSIKYHPKRK